MAFVPILFRGGRVRDLNKHPHRYGNWIVPDMERQDMFPDEFLMLLDNNNNNSGRFGRKRCCSCRSGICSNNNRNNGNDQQQIANKKFKDGFDVNLEVQNFDSDRISVRANDEGIVVEGHTEEKNDENQYVLKHFVHKYQLTDRVDDRVLKASTPEPDLSENAELQTVPLVIREADSSSDIDAEDSSECIVGNSEANMD